MTTHLAIAPILLPLAAGATLLLVKKRSTSGALAIAASAVLVLLAAALAVVTDRGGGEGVTLVYRVGDWPAAVAIVLVADRLAAAMVLLASVLGLVNTLYGFSRWSRLGPYYLALSQFLLMGLNGAFLTGDLFNLFVFFEILLAASYGLLLHGSGAKRVGAGLHYIVINLAASLLFLIGVSLIFGVAGSLNMAALAGLIPTLPPQTRSLAHAGAAILGVAFLIKAAAWPMGFWLPRTYEAAAPPAAAMFAIMTKVGVYAVMRLGLLFFGPHAAASAGFGDAWLFVTGVATVVVGVVGMLAANDLGRITGYSVVVSAGVLLSAIVFRDAAVLAGALLYLVISTLGAAALYLLDGLIGPDDVIPDEPPLLEAYDPEGAGAFTEEDETAVVIPAPIGVLSAGFLICTLLIAGIPPLPGFLAKVAMLAPLLHAPAGPTPGAAAILATVVIASSFFALFALARAGVQIWWAESRRVPPTIRLGEAAPLAALLMTCLLLTFVVEAPLGFLQRAADQALEPARYAVPVLGGAAP